MKLLSIFIFFCLSFSSTFACSGAKGKDSGVDEESKKESVKIRPIVKSITKEY